MIAAVAGEEAGLDGYGVAAARGFALAEVARGFPCGAEGYLNAYARAGLLVFLLDMVLNAFDVQTAFHIGIDSVGGGGCPFKGGVVVGLGKIVVFAFAAPGFAIGVETGLRAHGNAHAHRRAEAAVFAVGGLGGLAGFED